MIFSVLVLISGGITLCAGIWLIFPPAAIIAAGILLLAAGILIACGSGG